jgi:hypothetical protein
MRFIIAAALILAGVVWIAQGSGVLKGSFMTGQSLWLIVGIACAVIGLGLLLVTVRSSPR